MALEDIRNRPGGALACCLTIEGVPDAWQMGQVTSLFSGGDFPADVVDQWSGLQRGGLQWGSQTDAKKMTVAMPSLTFKLGDTRSQNAVSARVTAALQFGEHTLLTTTLDVAETGSMFVEDTSIFGAAPFVVWLNQEAILVDTVASGTELQDLTRGKYGSVPKTHDVIPADAEDLTAGILIPRVRTHPRTWYGRYCTLWAAEYLANGTLDVPEAVWKGRLLGDLQEEDGVWEVSAESLLDALNVEVPTRRPKTSIDGIVVIRPQGVSISTHDTDYAAFFFSPGQWSSMAEFLAALVGNFEAGGGGINGALFDAGDSRSVRMYVENQQCKAEVVNSLAAATGPIDVHLRLDVELAGVLGIDASYILNISSQVAAGDPPQIICPEVASCLLFELGNRINTDLPVISADQFVAFQSTSDSGEGLAVSVVRIGGRIFKLTAVDTGTDTISITYLGSAVANPDDYANGEHWIGTTWQGVRRLIGEPPIYVEEGVYINAPLFECWRDMFIENDDVPASWKRGIRTEDFDWDLLDDQLSGGETEHRIRVILDPASFQEMFFSDLRMAMIAPIVRDGRLAGMQLAPATTLEATASFTQTMKSSTKAPRYRRSTQRIVNQVIYELRGIGNAVQVEVNDSISQTESETTNTLRIESNGAPYVDKELSDAFAAQTFSYFALFAYDNPEVTEFGGFNAQGIQPGDAILVTEERLVNPETGVRGVTGAVMLVLGHKVTPYEDEVHVELSLVWVIDAVRRSGYAPAARITSFTDNGGGAGDERYELVINPGFYSDVNEATFFLVGAKVEIREMDSTSPTVESFTVTAAGNNGTSVFIDAAPSGGLQTIITNGDGLLVFDDYGTASQIGSAKLYVHVCDEDDKEIGATRDRGFQPV